MNSLSWAWKSLRRHPARTLLSIAGLVAVGALLLDMLLLSQGLLLSFEDLLEETGFDVRVTATSALPGFGPRIQEAARAARELERLPEVDEAVPMEFLVATVELGADAGEVTVEAIASEPRRRGEWELLEGREFDPGAEPPEILVSRSLARRLTAGDGEALGREIGLRTGPRGGDVFRLTDAPRFLVVGTARFPFETEGIHTVALSRGDVRQAGIRANNDDAELLVVASAVGVSPEETVAAIARARPDLHPFTIREAVEKVRAADFSYFRQVSVVLSVITSFFAFLLVTTVLTVSINQRLGEVAALRALGFSRRRIARDLAAEALLLVGLAGLLAFPAGLLLAEVLDTILRGMPGVPEDLHFFVLDPGAVLLHGLLLAASGLAASVWPAWVAARLPITDTLRKEVVG